MALRDTARKAVSTVRCLRETVQGQYGSGPGGYLKFLYYSFLRRNVFNVYELELGEGLSEHPMEPGYRVVVPSLPELEEIRRNRNLPREFYCDRFQRVSLAYLVMADDEPAYIHWVYLRGDSGRFLKLSKGVAEINYIHTLPAHRGKRLCTRVCGKTAADLRGLGIRKVACVIHEDNIASIKAVTKAGFRETGKITAIGPFNGKITV